MTELTTAITKNDTFKVRRLIEKGCDVNEKNEDDMTALMVAAIYGNTEIIKLLLKAKANVDDTDNEGWTALLYAKNKSIAKLFLRKPQQEWNIQAANNDMQIIETIDKQLLFLSTSKKTKKNNSTIECYINLSNAIKQKYHNKLF